MSRKEGVTLGPYRIIEQVGEGGMATVYKAYQPSMERNVALKILPERYARDKTFVERFIREARTIARLEHQNILPVHDFGEENGITYMAMRYLDGGTLKDVMAAGKLPYGDAVRLIDQVCAALDYAHRQGVIHRDVKPANIMIDPEGGVYLTDFGIAKVLEGAAGLTATGAAVGTPSYMAPEQSLGTGVDARSDIYAAGVILYELVTGTAPFRADTPMAVALAHIHDPLPLPRERDPDIPEEVENVILKALAKQPDDRFQTASELADAFSWAVADAGFDRAHTTMAALAIDAHSARTMESIPVDDLPLETLAILGAQAPQPEVLRRPGMPFWAWGAIVAGVVLVALVIVFALGGFGGGRDEVAEQDEPGDTAPSESGGEGEEAPAGDWSEAPGMFDTFGNPDYDGSFNDQLWFPYGDSLENCVYTQENGEFSIYKPDIDIAAECGLNANIGPGGLRGSQLGFFESRFWIGSDAVPFAEGILIAGTRLPDDQPLDVLCGMLASNSDRPEFWFEVVKGEESLQSTYMQNFVYDEWYTTRIEVDPATMTFSCLVDDVVVGSYTPENPQELQEALFSLRIHSWVPEGSQINLFVDDVKLGSSEGSDTGAFSPFYDSFDDPAYDGAFNDQLWWSYGGDSCDYHQEGTIMTVTRADRDMGEECGLAVDTGIRPPSGADLGSVSARFQIQGDLEPPSEANLGYWFEVPEGHYYVICGLLANNAESPEFLFEVIDPRVEDPVHTQTIQNLNYDTWYWPRLEVDPPTMTFTCYVDDQQVGTFSPENVRELQEAPVELHLLHTWHPAGSLTTVQFDDVTIERSGMLNLATFDDFNDPAFDGTHNPNLWIPPREELTESCLAFQQEGVLMMQTNPDVPYIDACGMHVREFQLTGAELTSVAFDTQVSSEGFDYGSDYGVVNRFNVGLYRDEDYFTPTCGPVGSNGNLFIHMEIWTPDGAIYSSPEYPINFDTGYRVNFEVDPATMTFTCFVDGQEIGTYTPDNADDLRSRLANRYFFIERWADSFAVVMVDNLAFYSLTE